MLKTSIAIMSLALATPSWAAVYRINVLPDDGQVSKMAQGVESVDSILDFTVVRLFEPPDWTDDRPTFNVAAFNRSNDPFNFGTESVALVLPDGSRVPMITFDELVREERSAQRRRRFAAILGAVSRGMAASQAGQTSGTIYAPYGRPVATYSGTDQGAQLQAQSIANAQSAREAAALRERHAQELGAIADVLRTTTVDPGKAYGGRALFVAPKLWRKKGDYPAEIEVTAGGVVHRFKVQVSRK